MSIGTQNIKPGLPPDIKPEIPPPPGFKPGRSWLDSGWIALLFFGLATVLYTWPLSLQLGTTLPDWGDAADSSWRIGSMAHQLRSDPFHLYQTTAFYPLDNGLALDELLTGQALLVAPLIWLTGNLPLAFNLLLFAAFTLSGWAMWLLVRHLTASSPAGLVAGLIFAFSPWHYGQYGHLGLVSQQWMVLALYFLIRFLHSPGSARGYVLKRRALAYLALFYVFMVLQALVAGYYAYFGAILAGFYLAYYLLFPAGLARRGRAILARRPYHAPPIDWARLARQLGLLAFGATLAIIVLLPLVLPFCQAQSRFSFRRDLSEVIYWSATPENLLRTSPQSWLYKPVQRGIFNLQTSAERMLYPGIVTLALALWGLLRPPARPAPGWNRRWLFAALSLCGLLLSFGPALKLEAYSRQATGPTLPYAWLYQLVPGFDALRVPLRFGQLFMLGLAVCAGYGLAALTQSRPAALSLPAHSRAALPRPRLWLTRTVIWPVVCALLITAEYIAPGQAAQPTGTGPAAPALYRWLAGEEAATVVPKEALLLELPLSQDRTPVNTTPLYLMYGLDHRRPMLNGSANIIPFGYDRLFYEMQSFPNPSTLDIIEGLGVRFVVVHTRSLPAEANRAELDRLSAPGGRLQLVKSFPDGPFQEAVYRVLPQPARFQPMARSVPTGATVLLADHPGHRKLYTTILPALLGRDRQYYSPYPTIYDGLAAGPRLLPPPRPRNYDYAVFYRGAANPGDYGLTLPPFAPVAENEVIQIFRLGN